MEENEKFIYKKPDKKEINREINYVKFVKNGGKVTLSGIPFFMAIKKYGPAALDTMKERLSKKDIF